MQVITWFGTFTLEKDSIVDVELFQKDIDAIITCLLEEPLLLHGRIAGLDLRDLAIKYGFVTSSREYDLMLHDINIKLAKKKMEQTVTADRKIIAAIEAIDDLDETGNILGERLKEWYMLNFSRIDLKGSELARFILETNDPEIEDLKMMRSFATGLLGLYEARSSSEEYLKKKMPEIAPNLTSIAGYLLGARLLCIAGSLENLASMPSSTVQVLGANNALFKHLKGKATSPKHGIIFRHPYVNTAPKWQRGKIARAVASKISLAARCDQYSGELKQNLSSDLEKKVMGIKKNYRRKSRV
ncbi:MAG: rRNA biogenesis protein [Candidatus Methanoperedens sp.]|nr:rRNA biogenesis protein [Candidatus Methanoperedens sp.]MCZ7360445.1 rRNA biogenesis protein [Candidatus Methanoperedens sp.]HLB70233.1 rRNA biogenesis protein [Candidatus Methanoperedens sp.]